MNKGCFKAFLLCSLSLVGVVSLAPFRRLCRISIERCRLEYFDVIELGSVSLTSSSPTSPVRVSQCATKEDEADGLFLFRVVGATQQSPCGAGAPAATTAVDTAFSLDTSVNLNDSMVTVTVNGAANPTSRCEHVCCPLCLMPLCFLWQCCTFVRSSGVIIVQPSSACIVPLGSPGV